MADIAHDAGRLEALCRFGRLLARETEVEPLARLIVESLAASAGSPAGTLLEPPGPDGRRTVLATHGATPPPGSAARPGELRIPLVAGDCEVALAVLAPGDDEGPDHALLDQLALQAAAALRAALAMREAERLSTINRAVLDAVRDGIGLVDDAGRLVLRNERLEQLARAMLPLPLDAPDDEPSTDEFRVRSTRQRFARYTEPVRDPAGERLGRVVVVRDVTRERDVEQRRDELIATIAHELRGPLAVITGFVELLASDSTADGDRARKLEIVRSESRRLHGLIDDLLDLERLQRGDTRLIRASFDLVAVLREQAELHGAASPSHVLDVRADPPSIEVAGERDRIAQVVGNLLSNAVKYSPGGGEIRVRARATAALASVTVSDPGLGIPDEEQPRIFERFYRAEPDAHQDIPGSGLGLALARQIVLAHGGRMGFRSVPGRGSRFWFTLPRTGSPGAP